MMPFHTKTAKITIRNVYGNDTIYPANDVAEIFAKIAGKKTLSNVDLLDMERLGFYTEIVAQQQRLPVNLILKRSAA